MLTIILAVFALLVLFFALGKGASLLIANLQVVIKKTKINPVLMGIILGFFTTIPEFAVGVNAIHNNIGGISLGNIWGGIIVLFTLMLGAAIVFNRQIKTDGRLSFILPSLLFIILSLVLAFRGTLDWRDGLIILFFYCLLIYIKFLRKQKVATKDPQAVDPLDKRSWWYKLLDKLFHWRRELKTEIKHSLIGIVIILITSSLIVEIADFILSSWSVSPFVIGLLIFSLGTNLPELIITLKSAFSKASDLSFGHLTGSAMSNTLILGLLSFFHTFTVNINIAFVVMFAFMLLALTVVALFYVTSRSFDRWEGFVLLGIYLLFITYQILAV